MPRAEDACLHEALLAQAALPEPRVICKLQMRAYSLGHELFLIRRGNPFLLPPEGGFHSLPCEAQVRAVVEAADVCSQSWNELNFVPQTRLQRWKKNRVWRKWDRALRGENWPAQCEAFHDYLAASRVDFPGKLPDDADGETRFIGAPELIRFYQFICRHVPAHELAFYSSGDSAPSAWDYPYALARLQHSAHQETEGNWSIYNWKDKCHDDFVAESEARKAQEGITDPGITITPAPEGEEATCHH